MIVCSGIKKGKDVVKNKNYKDNIYDTSNSPSYLHVNCSRSQRHNWQNVIGEEENIPQSSSM